MRQPTDNLLKQVINCDHGDRPAKIIQNALSIESDDVVTYCFPKTGQPIASSAPASSANGCKPRCGFWPDVTN